MEIFFFYLIATVAVASGVLVVACRNPINSALSLVMTFFCLAIFYVMLYAPFMAAIQVLVYAGAIMVLIIFVIMLLNLGEEARRRYTHGVALGGAVAAIVMFQVVFFLRRGDPVGMTGGLTPEVVLSQGHTELIGRHLFTLYVLPFEIVGVLLLVAIVGALVLAKRQV